MNTLTTPKISTNVRAKITLQSLRTGLQLLSKWSPGLALRWAERLFLSPQRHAWPAQEQLWLARAERGVLHTAGMPVAEWDGKPMVTYRWGEARRGKIVLLHGWSGRATQFHALIERLTSHGYQVVAIDAPGHGGSAGKIASVLHFAHALERLLRNEGAVDAVVAHSLGGAATVYALAESKLPVGKVALISPSADVAVYARYVGRLLGLSADLLGQMQQRMEQRLAVRWSEFNAISRAAELRQPALIIHDSDDKEVSAATGSAIAQSWPKARLRLTQGLGHRRILRDEGVVEELMRFIAEPQR